ncbi:hypothetical protein D9M71_555940 [compost metagenome]
MANSGKVRGRSQGMAVAAVIGFRQPEGGNSRRIGCQQFLAKARGHLPVTGTAGFDRQAALVQIGHTTWAIGPGAMEHLAKAVRIIEISRTGRDVGHDAGATMFRYPLRQGRHTQGAASAVLQMVAKCWFANIVATQASDLIEDHFVAK